jgi:hypothetical protein
MENAYKRQGAGIYKTYSDLVHARLEALDHQANTHLLYKRKKDSLSYAHRHNSHAPLSTTTTL